MALLRREILAWLFLWNSLKSRACCSMLFKYSCTEGGEGGGREERWEEGNGEEGKGQENGGERKREEGEGGRRRGGEGKGEGKEGGESGRKEERVGGSGRKEEREEEGVGYTAFGKEARMQT